MARPQVGPEEHVICALSGGVDSTVAATLVHKVVGDRLHCVFVDNGLLRYKVRRRRPRRPGVERPLLFARQRAACPNEPRRQLPASAASSARAVCARRAFANGGCAGAQALSYTRGCAYGGIRSQEQERVMDMFSNHLHLPVTCIDHSAAMLARLAGLTDPEAKRKAIGAEFIEVRPGACMARA